MKPPTRIHTRALLWVFLALVVFNLLVALTVVSLMTSRTSGL